MSATLETILARIAAAPDDTGLNNLIDLVAAIRPPQPDETSSAVNALRALTLMLGQNPAWQDATARYLMGVLGCRRQLHLLTDTGILSNESAGTAFMRRLGEKLLPPAYQDDYLKDALGRVFHRPGDEIWVDAVPDEIWRTCWQALAIDATRHALPLRHIHQEIIQAALVLSHRIAALGLEPELVRNHPAIEQFESPFLTQNHELRHYLTAYTQRLLDPEHPCEDDRHVRVLLGQCEEIMQKIRKHAARQGVSVSLTYLLVRLCQHLDRLRLLLDWLAPPQPEANPVVGLFKTLVDADRRKTSLRELIATNTDLIALQITEHAGRTGEHYIANDRSEWRQMARSAMGAGAIVGVMALFKLLLGKLVLAPLVQALAFSLNYSLGFILIHTLHFTIATKQPAMTAARIAASMDTQGRREDALQGLADLIEKVCRTQFVAIFGNVVLAIPCAAILALLGWQMSGAHWINSEKALYLLRELDPLHSLALPHAAIAGCCLFLSGLISGYYDNKAAYDRIPERLAQLRFPARLLGPARWLAVCRYVENNLGALAGNFFFGIMLGSIGTLGFLLGLPLDIRHITFAAANLAYALVALEGQVDGATVGLAVLGVGLIGLTNLAVSFGLALLVALRARHTTFVANRALLKLLLQRFLRSPKRFFLPPKEEKPAQELASTP